MANCKSKQLSRKGGWKIENRKRGESMQFELSQHGAQPHGQKAAKWQGGEGALEKE